MYTDSSRGSSTFPRPADLYDSSRSSSAQSRPLRRLTDQPLRGRHSSHSPRVGRPLHVAYDPSHRFGHTSRRLGRIICRQTPGCKWLLQSVNTKKKGPLAKIQQSARALPRRPRMVLDPLGQSVDRTGVIAPTPTPCAGRAPEPGGHPGHPTVSLNSTGLSRVNRR